MSIREKPLIPWAIIKKDGCVEAAHCTCMAGLGEACTHIGAMLWAISAAVTINREKSVTESKCYWLPCSANRNFMDSIKNADFTSSKQQKKVFDSQFLDGESSKSRYSYHHKDVGESSSKERDDYLSRLDVLNLQSGILTVSEKYQLKYKPKLDSQKFPIILTSLYDKTQIRTDFQDLQMVCNSIKIVVTQDEAKQVIGPKFFLCLLAVYLYLL